MDFDTVSEMYDIINNGFEEKLILGDEFNSN